MNNFFEAFGRSCWVVFTIIVWCVGITFLQFIFDQNFILLRNFITEGPDGGSANILLIVVGLSWSVLSLRLGFLAVE